MALILIILCNSYFDLFVEIAEPIRKKCIYFLKECMSFYLIDDKQ